MTSYDDSIDRVEFSFDRDELGFTPPPAPPEQTVDPVLTEDEVLELATVRAVAALRRGPLPAPAKAARCTDQGR